MFRIGVDTRLLCEQVTGIGRYNLETLSRLVSYGHEWVLYANRPITVGNWQRDNVKITIDRFPGDIPRHIWAQSILPWRANQDGLDLFWSPTHRLPNFLCSKIARVVTIHDLVWKHASETMRPAGRLAEKVLMPQAVRVADRIITDSRYTEKDLLDAFPSAAGKTKTIHLGKPEPSTGRQEVSPRLRALPEHYFLFVGTMEPRKNLERLLKAFARLPDHVRDQAKLVIVGGKGWGGIDAVTMIGQNDLDQHVELIGYVETENLARLYANALFLAMPSLHEGFGLPLLEAMSVGVPVLTSDCSSMPEVAGDAGLLVDPLDISSISNALRALLENTALRAALSEKALLQADKFSWEKTARETFEVFEKAINDRRQGVFK